MIRGCEAVTRGYRSSLLLHDWYKLTSMPSFMAGPYQNVGSEGQAEKERRQGARASQDCGKVRVYRTVRSYADGDKD